MIQCSVAVTEVPMRTRRGDMCLCVMPVVSACVSAVVVSAYVYV